MGKPGGGERAQVYRPAHTQQDGYHARETSDARIEDDVVALVGGIERDVAPIEVAVFNIGANVRFKVTDITERVYRKVWSPAHLTSVAAR